MELRDWYLRCLCCLSEARLRGVEVLSKERKKAESPEMRTRRVALKGNDQGET